jgi:hypothetical protein
MINAEECYSCIGSNPSEKLKVRVNENFTGLDPPPNSIHDLHDTKIYQDTMYTLFRPDVGRV